MNYKFILVVLLFIPFGFITGCSSGSSGSNSRKCVDVTSYDNNRNNDMKCTSSNGSVKYTSYEGAKVLQDQ